MISINQKTLIWIKVLLFFVPGLNGFSGQEVNLVFKTPIKEGEDLKLLCLFNLPKNGSIYTVKWYKGIREIFRYYPKDNEKKQIKFGDLIVDEKHSDMHTLMLKKVPSYMTGNVSCEVTPEPPFNLVTKTSLLTVVVLPKWNPKLETSLGMKNSMLIVNQKLSANCTSSPSKPSVNLTFVINDYPIHVNDPFLQIQQHQIVTNDDFQIESASLEMNLQSKYFIKGKVKLKCIGKLFDLWEKESIEFIGTLQSRPPNSQKQKSFFFGMAANITPEFLLIVMVLTLSIAHTIQCQ